MDKENIRAIIKRKEKEIEDWRKARDENFLSKVESEISRDPSMSIASLARKFDVDRKTMSRCISEDLHCKSYRLQTGKFLSEKMREKRLNKSKKLLNGLFLLGHVRGEDQQICSPDQDCPDQHHQEGGHGNTQASDFNHHCSL